jgi:hypothetical protein
MWGSLSGVNVCVGGSEEEEVTDVRTHDQVCLFGW